MGFDGFVGFVLVECVGVPTGLGFENSKIWVLTPDIQIDEHGDLLTEETQQYYWDVHEQTLLQLSVTLPSNNKVGIIHIHA